MSPRAGGSGLRARGVPPWEGAPRCPPPGGCWRQAGVPQRLGMGAGGQGAQPCSLPAARDGQVSRGLWPTWQHCPSAGPFWAPCPDSCSPQGPWQTPATAGLAGSSTSQHPHPCTPRASMYVHPGRCPARSAGWFGVVGPPQPGLPWWQSLCQGGQQQPELWGSGLLPTFRGQSALGWRLGSGTPTCFPEPEVSHCGVYL